MDWRYPLQPGKVAFGQFMRVRGDSPEWCCCLVRGLVFFGDWTVELVYQHQLTQYLLDI